jgi:hypothetical protein
MVCIQLHDHVVNMVEELITEAGVAYGLHLRLEVRCTRSIGLGSLGIDVGMLYGSTSRSRIAALVFILRLLVLARAPVSMLWQLPSRFPIAF